MEHLVLAGPFLFTHNLTHPPCVLLQIQEEMVIMQTMRQCNNYNCSTNAKVTVTLPHLQQSQLFDFQVYDGNNTTTL
jgi:predicted secreted Zn-dependent protease